MTNSPECSSAATEHDTCKFCGTTAMPNDEPNCSTLAQAYEQTPARPYGCPWFDKESRKAHPRPVTGPVAQSVGVREALEECLGQMGWTNYTDDEMREEKRLGNGKAAIILRARAALAAQPPAAPVETGDFYLVPREIIDQFPEINVNNYDHDDACALNAWGCEVVTNANPAPVQRCSADTADPIEVEEDDPDVMIAARAIAEHGFGRPWDDFHVVNAFDTDQGDLIEYGRAAVAALRSRAAPQAAPVGTDPTDYTELRASLADNITLFSHHKAALLRLVDAKIASTLTRPHGGGK